MRGFKKLLMLLLILVLFGSVFAGMMWHTRHYVMIDFQFYPKNAQILDLRGQEISVRHYKKLSRRLPETDIEWDVPLSQGVVEEHAETITIAHLTDEDVEILDYLQELKTVEAEGCTDYLQLLALQNRRPEVEVHYSVTLGTESFHCRASRIEVRDLTAEEIGLFDFLPELETVICGGGDEAVIGQVQNYCRDHQLEFGVNIGGQAILDTVRTVSASDAREEDLTLLKFLSGMETLHLENPAASAESLLRLRENRPDVKISWEMDLFGQPHSTEDKEIDLSKAEYDSLEEVEAALAYFPNVETLFLGKPAIDNETIAAYRERIREDYKVVWVVQLGNKLTARTDDTTFMPTREHVYYFNDEEAYNLRYCEDMVCIDIGHMSISDIEFVKFMPNLEYLILAHTQVQHIDPISSCKKLKFLELDWSPLKDATPLLGCTALEDLNMGNTYADFEPVGKMTWLKNLWMIGCSSGARYRMTQALPDTKVMVTGSATVANGWRDLENYYAMRDLLGMHYMSW